MNTINIVPVEGRLILMPERGMARVPAEGATVEANSFYRLAIINGDLEEVDELPVPGAAQPANPLTTADTSADPKPADALKAAPIAGATVKAAIPVAGAGSAPAVGASTSSATAGNGPNAGSGAAAAADPSAPKAS